MILKYIVTFLISMVPLIELRGAVPFGLSDAMGGSLSIIPLYIVCIIGNMVPVPLIYFFARKVLEWGKDKKLIGKFFTWCLTKGEKAGKKLETAPINIGTYSVKAISEGNNNYNSQS